MRIAEGWIENEGMVELYLPDVLRASFTCGDGAWMAMALVERNGGTGRCAAAALRGGAEAAHSDDGGAERAGAQV